MRIIRLKDVIDSTGIARSTIYKLIGEGEFPKPVPLVGRTVGWVESEVQEWIRGRIAQRDLTEASMAVVGR
ncbi:TPA: AlpA family transcriptional regulator [Pseudomonas aeruginosa]|uniref:helix-turn-helix transcriptional regulator n=1 Tax=Pseudomonas aeruginosa TaxID=287 RepID=UPI0009A42B39|nr:AlpA family transcriptional regulator [Pseudomonas aeruginosa]AYK22939.1 AlpA family transcriptional regulator [Pseudomonas aeruginosa]EIU1435941.1 AlpA family transcriptional regulator [Pseudomonas aeruginosa]EKU1304869.1 AlpA family transcriptional regulator [Pseudomonas aeruginosa]EKU1943639.1 AlpA family transcriptional regulator [Pseudomonas aeruginosa]EKU4050449.1 AlpA family transcriptional regulator [Pseudomonas aeruginosa]